MSTYKRKQGDSLWIDIQCDSVATIDVALNSWPANWDFSWDIKATAASATVLLSGKTSGTQPATPSCYKVTETPGLFQLRIGPVSGAIAGTPTLGTTPWASLPEGSYVLTTQYENSNVDYRHEEQDKIVISTQGIAP
jgi:hypothetical protein